ncbi:MAG: winged helix-turn-helix transcriptional regulator [bacterium]|nr:winged helix-turn-helix transcriptional regulator [bacterium]
MVSYVAKGLLPYHGLGSGIKRALEKWPRIDFVDDRDGCLFTVTVHRKELNRMAKTILITESSEKDASEKCRKSVGKTAEMILEAISQNNSVTIAELAARIGVAERSIERNIQKLRADNMLKRTGGRKEGHWEVIE